MGLKWLVFIFGPLDLIGMYTKHDVLVYLLVIVLLNTNCELRSIVTNNKC